MFYSFEVSLQDMNNLIRSCYKANLALVSNMFAGVFFSVDK